MKAIVFLILFGIQPSLLLASEMPLDEVNENYRQCFQNYYCKEFEVKVPSGLEAKTFEEQKEIFFYSIDDQCNKLLPKDIYAKFHYTSGHHDFFYEIGNSKSEILSILGCTPSKNFTDMIPKSGSSQTKKAYRISAPEIGCADKNNVYHFGFSPSQDSPTGCKRNCPAGMVEFTRAKNGYQSESKSNGAGIGQWKRTISDTNGNLVAEVTDDNTQYYDVYCASCSDPSFFKDTSFTTTHDDDNSCFDANDCPFGQHYAVDAKRCVKDCDSWEDPEPNGRCRYNAAKVCDHVRKTVDVLSRWNYRANYVGVAIQRCTSDQVLQAVDKNVKHWLEYYKPYVESCAKEPNKELRVYMFAGIELEDNLKDFNCFDNNQGHIPQVLEAVPGLEEFYYTSSTVDSPGVEFEQ